MWLSSNWFIGFTDLEMKNHESNQTRSVSIGSDRFQTEPNKIGYFFGLVQFEPNREEECLLTHLFVITIVCYLLRERDIFLSIVSIY